MAPLLGRAGDDAFEMRCSGLAACVSLATAALAGGGCGGSAHRGVSTRVGPTPERAFVAHWSSDWAVFRRLYLRSLDRCQLGPGRSCARAQLAAAAAGVRVTARLAAPPRRLRAPVSSLRSNLGELVAALRASAAHQGSSDLLCRAENGPCTPPSNELVNAIGDINDVAMTDLAIPG